MNSNLEQYIRQTMELLLSYRMPFGKFGPEAFPPDGLPIYELPYEYLRYFERRSYPRGKLGELMKFVHDIKKDGAEEIFAELRRKNGRFSLRPPKKRIKI